jgi:D-xylose transport system permease protein
MTTGMQTVKTTTRIDWRSFRSIAALVLLGAALALLTQGTFLSPRNLTNLTRQVAINGILAVGMTYVILIGGIDLSVGSVVALAGVVTGICQVTLGWSQWTGPNAIVGALGCVLLSTLVGLACGVTNGFLITRLRIAPFVITLGMMVIARGLALIFAKGAAIAPLGETFNELGQGYVGPEASVGVMILIAAAAIYRAWRVRGSWSWKHGMALLGSLAVAGGGAYAFSGYRGLPYPVVIFGVLALMGSAVLNSTRLGRFVLALGGNPDAAWLAGVPSRAITFGIYAVMGALAGLSGAILSARLNGALPTSGELFELDAIAAVVIGGTSLQGGLGTIGGSILGAFFIGALNNGMSLLDVTEFYQKVIKGVIIVAAVALDRRGGGRGRS